METIQIIRDLEASVISDIKNSNAIISIKKYMKVEQADNVTMAAFHSLRRIFSNIMENGFLKPSTKNKESDQGKARRWMLKQLNDYKEILYEWTNCGNIDRQVPAVRTILEFVTRDYLLMENNNTSVPGKPSFGADTYTALFQNLLQAKEIGIDLLLMIREEVLSKADCVYYAMLVLSSSLRAAKANASSISDDSRDTLIRNAVDIMRVIELVDEVDESDLLCVSAMDNDGNEDEEGVSSDDSDDDNEDQQQQQTSVGAKRKLPTSSSTDKTSKKARRPHDLSRFQQIRDPASHKRIFNRAWLTLLSMPLTNTQHKLILRHLPEHVVPHMLKPLLLADYLTCCYDKGGAVAVLALESLCHLIIAHKLDYPKYFESLYRLCTPEIFGAKYRAKFMKLLHMSLKSSNLPAYTVAAFIKRLSRVSLQSSSPSALFCVAQITWLLRKHPQCQVLIHRTGSMDPQTDDAYDSSEEIDLEKTQAMESSLWEAIALQNHHLHSVAALAKALKNEISTSSKPTAPALVVEEFITHSYADLMEADMKRIKKNGALAYKEPKRLLQTEGLIDSCFGSNV
eukprot:gene2903-5694_t